MMLAVAVLTGCMGCSAWVVSPSVKRGFTGQRLLEASSRTPSSGACTSMSRAKQPGLLIIAIRSALLGVCLGEMVCMFMMDYG